MTHAVLGPLTRTDVELVRAWREQPETRRGLRRPDPLTAERQARWYDEVVCRPETSPHRFWAVRLDDHLVAQVSLESIDPHVKAEIGLITDPAVRVHGIGRAALELLLARGFDELGLDRIWGVVYRSNSAVGFWMKMLADYQGVEMADDDWTETNCADGREWPSRRFWFTAEGWRASRAGGTR